MNKPPIADDALRSINERYLAYLDALYAPRDYRRRFLVAGTVLGALLISSVLILALLHQLHGMWLLLPFGVVLVGRGIFALQGIHTARKQFRNLRNVIRHGVPVTAYIVQAHEALYHPGRDTLPCLVLFSFQQEVEQDAGYMHYLAQRIFAMKNTKPEDPDGEYLASLTTDECPIPYRRRRLPFSFTDGSTIYCADLWVKRAYLKDGHLKTNALPCLAEPGEVGGIELVPSWLLNGGENTVLTYRQELEQPH
ncbi:MAG: hypothetical protein OHK0029_30990 [Armatimonadaceae bacterium]